MCLKDVWPGYKRALKEAHLPFAQEHIYMGSIHEDRQLAMLQSLAGHIFDYTAVIFSRDYYALEAMDYFRHHGIWIPKDISIIGFDDLGMSKFAYPRLTTVRQGAAEKGRKAAELLFQALEEKEDKKVDIRIPVRLMERENGQRNLCINCPETRQVFWHCLKAAGKSCKIAEWKKVKRRENNE